MACHNMPARGRVAGAAAAIALAAAGATPASGGAAELRAETELTLEATFPLGAEDEDRGFDEIEAKAETALSLTLPSDFGVLALLVLEPVTDAEADRYFRDVGLFVEELYAFGPVGTGDVRIGKLNLSFGLANDEAPGLFGDEIAGEYELTERLGIDVEVPLSDAPGAPSLSAAAFMADRTPLSGSVMTKRERLHRRDGGVSNTGFLESALIGLSGRTDETSYNAGLRYQTRGKGDAAGEFGGVMGITHDFELAVLELAAIGEAAYFPRFDGARNAAGFLTLGAAGALGPVELSAVYGRGWFGGSPDTDAVAVGLDFEMAEGLTLSAGYLYRTVDSASRHDLGLQLTYELQFP